MRLATFCRPHAPFLGGAIPSVYHCRFPRRSESAKAVNRQVLNFVLMGLALMAVWLLLSGLFKPLLIALATASVLLTLWLGHRMEIIDGRKYPMWAAARFVPYWPWLGVEIVKSSFDVARRVLSPSMPISPTVFEVDSSQLTGMGRVVYANSITLTPGTVTLDIEGTRLRVHALSRDTIEYLLSGEMDRRVTLAEAAAAGADADADETGSGATPAEGSAPR